ncbi:hypothetical protein AC481_00095 [miscellaneous Crenarchaeota group archaeon SMTZ-80]|nr:MAG: hypothetical protein AC481_00095 [miscellaneous Crenarchaeota group archaeon SMTZ-80]
MSFSDDSAMISKVKRVSDRINIHNLFIFNKSGICIYGINLTNLYRIEQEQLISSYFTALMSFTKELIGDKIKTLEMGGGIKLVVFEKLNIFYCLLCNSIENLLLLEELISKIHSKFMIYVRKNNIKIDLEYISDENLNFLIDDIIKDTLSNEFDLEKEEKIIEYLKEFSINADIIGIILLTDRGKLVYSSLSNIEHFLKEVDFRVKICNNSILKLFYTSKNSELIFSEYIKDKYLVITVFDFQTRFGIAELYIHKIVKKIEQILVND